MFLSNDTPENYYTTNFALVQNYHWSFTELEEMYPFEREIYVSMMIKYQNDMKQNKQQK